MKLILVAGRHWPHTWSLGGAPRHDQEPRLVAEKRAIDLAQHRSSVIVVDPITTPVGRLSPRSRPFAQELGSRRLKLESGRASPMIRPDFVTVPTGTVDLVTTSAPAARRRHFARGGIDIAQIGMAIAATRGMPTA